jgi:prepilin-type N-terminal cleavage/methylation domain-containing protein
MWCDKSSRRRPGGRGLTAIEVLISTAIFAVVAASVHLLYTSMLNTYTKGELRAEVQQSARIALAQITQDLRGAGYDPSGALAHVVIGPSAALRAALPACVSFVTYGVSGGLEASIQVTYTLNAGAVQRRVDPWDAGSSAFEGGVWTAVAQSIEALQFTYYDGEGAVLAPGTEPPAGRCPPSSSGPSPPVNQLSVEQMRRVRRIEVALRARATAPRLTPELFVLGSDVHLRNR